MAARGHVFDEAFGEPGTAGGQFEEPAADAVNEETGDVYVVDEENNRVQQLSSTGTFISAWGWGVSDGKAEFEVCTSACEKGIAGVGEGQFEAPGAIAVDNSTDPLDPSKGDVYVATKGEPGHQVVDKFSPAGAYLGQIKETSAGPFTLVLGVAVDPAGKLWIFEETNGAYQIAKFNHEAVNEFEEFCTPMLTGANPDGGLAVDSNDDLYVRTVSGEAKGAAVELNADCQTLNEAVDSEATTGVSREGIAVEAQSEDLYVDNVESVARFAPGGSSPIERFGEGHLVSGGCQPLIEVTCLSGVAVSSTAGLVYAVNAESDQVVVFALEGPAAPNVEAESMVKVTDDSVTLEAMINPRSLTGEADTLYHFEYGVCPGASATCVASGYPSVTSVDSLSPTFEVDDVRVSVEGLHAGTTYHFRVLAENVHSDAKPVEGVEQTLTTDGTGEFGLPDGRQWEMVSPVDRHGALIEPLNASADTTGAALVQAAAAGGAITYAATAPTESEPPGYSNFTQVLSTRTADGWSSRDLAIPHDESTNLSIGEGQELRYFSEDLSLAIVQPFGRFLACRSPEGTKQPCLSEEASEQTTFLHNIETGTYTPLVTGKEGYSNVPEPGTAFGVCSAKIIDCGPEFVGGSSDLSHVVLQSGVALTSTPIPSRAEGNTVGALSVGALYEWSAGMPAAQQLQLVSLLPPSSPGSRRITGE